MHVTQESIVISDAGGLPPHWDSQYDKILTMKGRYPLAPYPFKMKVNGEFIVVNDYIEHHEVVRGAILDYDLKKRKS